MQLLNQQAGIVNFAPLKPFFTSLFIASRAALPTVASVPSLPAGLQRTSTGLRSSLPALCYSLQPLIEDKLKGAYRATTAGKFNEALTLFLHIMNAIPFLVVESKKEINEVKYILKFLSFNPTSLRPKNCLEFAETMLLVLEPNYKEKKQLTLSAKWN